MHWQEEMLKGILLAVILAGICALLLSVRIIFGKKKEFLRGHSCSVYKNEKKI